VIVVLPYCPKDEQLAKLLVAWITELGGFGNRKVMLIHDDRCGQLQLPPGTMQRSVQVPINDLPWPQPHNMLFRYAAGNSEKTKEPFLWLEPDVVPITAHWLDAIEEEYNKFKKPFMGARVIVENIPEHMSGIGVYPPDMSAKAHFAVLATEVAWDVQGAPQIIPQAHWTNLIVHNWKHDRFNSMSEVDNLLGQHPGMVLFHADKAASLIPFLREKKDYPITPVSVLTDPATVEVRPKSSIGDKAGEAREGTKTDSVRSDSRGGSNISCDIFIKTFIKDFEWLTYCTRSITRFASGFKDVVLVSSENLPPLFMKNLRAYTKPDEGKDGYLVQQAIKATADQYCGSDYILHIDSDTIFTRPVTPESFFRNGKPYWLMTPYEKVKTPWQPIVGNFFRQLPTHEFMRRQAQVIPRDIYRSLDNYCDKMHGMGIFDYIVNQQNRSFSEFNVIGFFCWLYHRERFTWIDTEKDELPELVVNQYRSWNAIAPEVKNEMETILAGKQSSMETVSIIPGKKGLEEPSRLATPSFRTEHGGEPRQNIKTLPSGIWVIQEDTHVSKWIEQENRLDHDQNTLPFILPHIKPDSVVIDAGAFVGDHTVAYLKAVGPKGHVHAFEPNRIAFQCLIHNVDASRVTFWNIALGETQMMVEMSRNNNNFAGSYLHDGTDMVLCQATMMPLDSFRIAPDFIKWDIEGCELKALKGAELTIKLYRPVMVMEINYEALRRQGDRVGDIFDWLDKHGYSHSIIQDNCSMTSPMYDILCIPSGVKPEAAGVPRCLSPVATPEGPYKSVVKKRRRKRVKRAPKISPQTVGP